MFDIGENGVDQRHTVFLGVTIGYGVGVLNQCLPRKVVSFSDGPEVVQRGQHHQHQRYLDQQSGDDGDSQRLLHC